VNGVDEVDTADRYKSFALEQAHGGSAIYQMLSESIAADADFIRLLDELPSIKRQPNLLFGAVRFLDGPITTFETFKNWTLENWEQVSAAMQVRLTQTNEVARCATLLPLLARIKGPLALLEVGASAGLCLYPDKYQYQYGEVRVGDPNSPLVLNCKISGSVPIPDQLPEVVWRGGIDLNPLDLANPDDYRWLESLIWPDQPERLDHFRMAASIVQADPPNLVKGDLNQDLLTLVEEVPTDATLVIFHSAVLAYLSQDLRTSFANVVRELPGHWISNEGPRVFPSFAQGLKERPAGSPARFLMALDEQPIAWTGPHGQCLEWLAN